MSPALPIAAARPGGFLAAIRRRGALFAAVFCILLGLAIGSVFLLPVRYVATGAIAVRELGPAAAGKPQPHAGVSDPDAQLLVLRSPRLLRAATQRPGVAEAVVAECRYDAASNPLSRLRRDAVACDALAPGSAALLDHVQSRYRIAQAGTSRILDVSYRSPLPDTAQRMVNALIAAFLDEQRPAQPAHRDDTTAVIRDELRRLEDELRGEIAKLGDLRAAETASVGKPMPAPQIPDRLASIRQRLSAAEAARDDAAARLAQPLRRAAAVRRELQAVSAEVERASRTLGPKHPTLRELRRERDALQRRLAAETARVPADARKAHDAATAAIASLRRQMEAVRAESRKEIVPSAAPAFATDHGAIEALQRSIDGKRQRIADLAQRLGMPEAEPREAGGGEVLAASLAELPSRPDFPKAVPLLAAWFALAFLAAAGAALLRDRSDRTVRAASDLSALTSLPVLAQMPRLRGVRAATGSPGGALQRIQADQAMQDALRKLFASLALAGGGKRDIRRILVTSPGRSEGRTLTALSLAQFAASAGRRVLAIECDLRQPSFAQALALGPSPGLVAVLRGDVPPEAAIVKSAHAGPDILPAGAPRMDSTELFMRLQMQELMLCADRYELAVFDGPPIAPLMDAPILAKYADGVLCCTRWGQSPIAATIAAADAIREADGRVIGFVITAVDRDRQGLFERA
ncbi:MAG: lipopolysaccharide biosynthesis protein [Pseudorhodoplanes sp.]|nr:lipopolysaccharide biosynthesis protein [Pseudorhodoplanes sp.]